MLSVFVRAFQTPDLRKKLLFSGAMIALFRFGANLPTPGISEQNVRYCSHLAGSGGVFAVLNLLSGNSLLHLTVFAIGILPYITATIIVQMLTQVIPRLETLRKQGQAGQAKITQYTRYVSVGLGLVYAVTYVQAARTGAAFSGSGCGPSFHPLIPHPTPLTIGTMVITMVSGTAVIMWMGELITDRGVGNGMSVLMFTSIVAVIPGEIEQIYTVKRFFYAATAVLVIIAVTTLIVFIEQGQRRIPVQYAKRISGRRMYGGASTFIPVKVNQAGVVPVIFASSLLAMPQLAVSMFGNQRQPQGWVAWIDRNLDAAQLVPPYLYFGVFFGLILGFTFFYVSVTFNPDELSDNIRRYGGFVPGLRPGAPTSAHLGFVLSRLTVPGAVYLALIALFPLIALDKIGLGHDLQLSGVSLLIMVSVGLDTVKQIQSQLEQHSYQGFLHGNNPLEPNTAVRH
ncbi:MAG TPA: preprotein translocase subunit SecY [Streptosporangiaceae bacterium]|nr:preprotein translocase subunit SecY [Streptosporangiaceae bacterium]